MKRTVAVVGSNFDYFIKSLKSLGGSFQTVDARNETPKIHTSDEPRTHREVYIPIRKSTKKPKGISARQWKKAVKAERRSEKHVENSI